MKALHSPALFFTTSVLAGNSAHSLQVHTYPNIKTCAQEPSFFSCENTTQIANTCCSPTPGGLVLATQLWSTYTGLEHKGQKLPRGHWTIHGLWPDNCDGTFQQYCDFSRQYDPTPSPANLDNGTIIPPYKGPGIGTFVKRFGRGLLLNYSSSLKYPEIRSLAYFNDLVDSVNKFWINQNAPNEAFWAHEFSKHATCTSTFDVDCYGKDYKKYAEVIDFFDATIRAYHHFPTYNLLAAGGIIPSNRTAYKLDDLETIVKSQTGSVPFFGCVNNGTVLNEVWYFNHVYGMVQFGSFKAVDTTTPSTCTRTGKVWYYERAPGSEHDVDN